MELSRQTVTTFHPLHPEITKANIASQFGRDEQQLPSLDELRAIELNKAEDDDVEKGGVGSGRKGKGGATGYSLLGKYKHTDGYHYDWDPSNKKLNKQMTVYSHNESHFEDMDAQHHAIAAQRWHRSAKQYGTELGDKNHEKEAMAMSRFHTNMSKKKMQKSEEDNLQKAEFNTKDRKKLAKEGEARKDGSFPIKTKKDLENAIHDVGRASNPAGAKSWIKQRAKDLKCEDCLPEHWTKGEEDELEKAEGGEGSRGGKVVGHTKTGKAKYEHFLNKFSDHPKHWGQATGELPELHHAMASLHNEGKKESEQYTGHLQRSKTPEEHNKRHKEGIRHLADKLTEKQHKHIEEHYGNWLKEKKKPGSNRVEKAFNDIMGPDPVEKAFDDLFAKGGEGSKGGKVIGHTKTGKPIYESKSSMPHAQWKKHGYHDEEEGYDKYLDAVHSHLKTNAGDDEEMEHHIEHHADNGYAGKKHPKHVAAHIDKMKKEKDSK